MPNEANLQTFLPEHCTAPPADPSSPASHDPSASRGDGAAYITKAPVLVGCYAQWETENIGQPGCTWWDTPPRPGTSASRAEQRVEQRAGEEWALTPSGQRLSDWVRELDGSDYFGPHG
jgi:hypothetical protein